MIDWKEIAAEPDEGKTEEFGRQIFTIYQDVVTSNKPDGQLTTLELLALAAGESASSWEAAALAHSYNQGVHPLKPTDFSAVLFRFVNEFARRFHEPLCAELRENKDIVLLAPTIVTLLNLPVGIAALAIPLSAIISRVGISGLCKDTEEKPQDVKLTAELTEIHRANLRYLEEEKMRYLPDRVPPDLDRTITFEKRRLRSLQDGRGE
jgi:hypothetical protein